ncbi:MAG TPA: hypothetical protein VG225_02215 [Terracidiphilus sp.]|jgi:hypothetical protein|nr:hypothetical protein [Terracidiphilus sp.]
MKSGAALCFSFCFGVAVMLGPVALGAQKAASSPAPAQLVMNVPAGNGCPIGMRAEHGTGSGLVMTRDDHGKQAVPPGKDHGYMAKEISQQIHLTLTNPLNRKIAAARVTARGLTARGRITKTLSTGDDGSNVTRTVDVKFSSADGRNVSADVTFPAFTVVNSIQMESITYADGSVWKLDDAQTCRVVPDPLMLVDAH